MPPLPTHPDYAQILQIIAEHDDQAGHCTIDELHEGRVDPDSLRHAAHGRARSALTQVPMSVFLTTLHASVAAVWADGFLAGVDFNQTQQSPTPTSEENES